MNDIRTKPATLVIEYADLELEPSTAVGADSVRDPAPETGASIRFDDHRDVSFDGTPPAAGGAPSGSSPVGWVYVGVAPAGPGRAARFAAGLGRAALNLASLGAVMAAAWGGVQAGQQAAAAGGLNPDAKRLDDRLYRWVDERVDAHAVIAGRTPVFDVNDQEAIDTVNAAVSDAIHDARPDLVAQIGAAQAAVRRGGEAQIGALEGVLVDAIEGRLRAPFRIPPELVIGALGGPEDLDLDLGDLSFTVPPEIVDAMMPAVTSGVSQMVDELARAYGGQIDQVDPERVADQVIAQLDAQANQAVTDAMTVGIQLTEAKINELIQDGARRLGDAAEDDAAPWKLAVFKGLTWSTGTLAALWVLRKAVRFGARQVFGGASADSRMHAWTPDQLPPASRDPFA